MFREGELGRRSSPHVDCPPPAGRRLSGEKGEGLLAKNNYLTAMCSGSEAGSYLRLIDLCITQF